jgi:OmpA family/Ankyrin repeats (many copies)
MNQFQPMLIGLILGCWLNPAWPWSTKITDNVDAFFEKNRSLISLNDASKLLEMVNRIEHKNIEVLIVVGHADTNENTAQKLSEQRALTVVKYLMNFGVPPNRIYAEGKADKELIETGTQREKNRRVEVEYVGLPAHNAPTVGFNLMQTWSKIKADTSGDLVSKVIGEWAPLEYLARIEDTQARQVFAHKLALHSIFTHDESVLAVVASKLGKCDIGLIDLPNPYLLAMTWGSVDAQRMMKHCVPSDATDQAQREKMFRHAFCSAYQETPSSWSKLAENLYQQKKFLKRISAEKSTDLFTCLMNDDRTKWLIENGAGVAVNKADAKSALLYAVTHGQINSVKLLLEAGADARAQDLSGRTLLHLVKRQEYAVPPFRGSLPKAIQKDLWFQLVAHGADPSAKDSQGNVAVEP